MAVKDWKKKYEKSRLSGHLKEIDQRDVAVSLFLKDQKKRFLRTSRFGGNPSRRAEGKRFWRRKATKFLDAVYRRRGNRRGSLKNIQAFFFKPGTAVDRDGLNPTFLKNWIPMRRRLAHRSVEELSLENFSFAKNPHGTLERLRELTHLCTIYPDLRMNFLDTDCDDVTPYIVLAHLSRSLPPIISGGRMTGEVSEVIDAVGMRSALRIGSIGRKNRGSNGLVSAFRLVDRAPPGAFGDEDYLLRPQLKERVADKFCDTLNLWLGNHDLELTEGAESSFVRALGEALDNAERHGASRVEGGEGDWSIAAFSKLIANDSQLLLRCSVGIVSVGATISDSLISAADQIRDRIDGYVGRHTPLFAAKHSSECLRTVMALQDGITRVEKATIGRRGGVGFMELIDIFGELGDNGRDDMPSVFTIISGKACIKVTAPHNRGILREDGMRQLWFNDSNDANVAPNHEHVFSLENAFPGVILSACFTIDPTYLKGRLEQ
jgi:hypothetical protein